ncbi:MAG: winged helix-turn-helix transcriptional regulator [Sneathiella sp.]|nr:winged helix-turn-helix transcriptional regulator [Sneathiella sp.]
MNTEIQNTFRALADPTRRSILMHLSAKEMTIAEVSAHFDMTRAAVKKHLIILEEGELISARRMGRETLNRLEPEGLKTVANWVNYFSGFWNIKLQNLQSAIEEEGNSKK